MFTVLVIAIAIPVLPADILRSLQDAALAEVPAFEVTYVDCRAVLEALTPENALVLTPIEEFRALIAGAHR